LLAVQALRRALDGRKMNSGASRVLVVKGRSEE
jgi:hypothetical protein